MELALAIARIVGEENRFIRLFRQVRADAGSAMSQAVIRLRNKIRRNHPDRETIQRLMADCADVLADNNLDQGAALIGQIMALLLEEKGADTNKIILQECLTCLQEFKATRLEYLILALHTMAAGWLR